MELPRQISGGALCLESSALGLSPTRLFFQYALLSHPVIHLILCAMDTYFGYLAKATFDTHILSLKINDRVSPSL